MKMSTCRVVGDDGEKDEDIGDLGRYSQTELLTGDRIALRDLSWRPKVYTPWPKYLLKKE